MLVRIMGDHSVDTLRILRAGNVAPTEDLYAHIREEAEQLPDDKIVTAPEYDESDDSEDPKPLGWYDMSYDVGIWVESPLSLAWIGLAWLSKPALLTEHVATVAS